ncbi:MAG: CBS domain-containing protein [Planctomycetota bacterium]
MSPLMQKETVTVGELMSTELCTVHPTTTIGEALNVFFDQKLTALPVVEGDRCVGIVTASDLVVLIRAVDQVLRSDYPHYEDCYWAVDLIQKKLDQDPVRDIMSEVVVTATPDQLAADAANVMLRQSIHHLPVIQQDKLVGFFATTDLVLGWVGEEPGWRDIGFPFPTNAQRSCTSISAKPSRSVDVSSVSLVDEAATNFPTSLQSDSRKRASGRFRRA